MKSFIVIGVLLSCLLLRAEAADAEQYSCNPATDCEDKQPGDKVPDSENCSQYYICLQGGPDDSVYPSDNPVACPEGKYFDWEEADCVDNGGTACKDLCINLCNITCSGEGNLLANPKGCGFYYFCISETDFIETSCEEADAPYFDGLQCQNDSTKCCDICTPYCYEDYTETLDPYDCSRYYLCLSQGIPSDTDSHSCPDGQHFNSEEGRCTDGADCDTLCSAAASRPIH